MNIGNNIHPSAIIEDGVILGNNITVDAYAIIKNGVKIGDNTSVGAYSLIQGNTTIGENNEIFSHASIGSIPQDLKFAGEDVELIIGDFNKIREFTLLNPGTKDGGGKTVIGSKNLLMGYVHVAHDVIIGDNCIFANAVTLAGHINCGDYVVIGGLTPVHQFCTIGSHAMVAGASALAQDVPPFCLAEGNRAKLRGLNLNGLRRRFNNKEDINLLKKAYKQLFASSQCLQDVARELKETSKNVLVLELVEFVLNTKRGIPLKLKTLEK